MFTGALGALLVATGVWNVDSSTRPWPSGVRTTAMSARTPSSPTSWSAHSALDRCLALQFQAQCDEERDSSREILDHNADVIHPADRHATQSGVSSTTSIIQPRPAAARCLASSESQVYRLFGGRIYD